MTHDTKKPSSRLVVLSGCSGGGKSTLLNELKLRGFPTVEEPGRRIIDSEEKHNGSALPWRNPEAFARRAIEMSIEDMHRWPDPEQWVFFDRGLVDAASALSSLTDEPVAKYLTKQPRYHDVVFLTPPWPEIYVTDDHRQHTLADAEVEYRRLLDTYPEEGYQTVVLELVSVQERADAILEELAFSKID